MSVWQFDNVTSQLSHVQHVIDSELKAKLEKVIFDIRALLTLSPERQSARMSTDMCDLYLFG